MCTLELFLSSALQLSSRQWDGVGVTARGQAVGPGQLLCCLSLASRIQAVANHRGPGCHGDGHANTACMQGGQLRLTETGGWRRTCMVLESGWATGTRMSTWRRCAGHGQVPLPKLLRGSTPMPIFSVPDFEHPSLPSPPAHTQVPLQSHPL